MLMANKKSSAVWSRVEPQIRELAEKLAKAQGLTLSEYIRTLIISDLDRRSVFSSKLKKELKA